MQPPEPESVPSGANAAVISVPAIGLVSASPITSDVTVHEPSGLAAWNRREGEPSASRVRTSPSARHPSTRPSAAR